MGKFTSYLHCIRACCGISMESSVGQTGLFCAVAPVNIEIIPIASCRDDYSFVGRGRSPLSYKRAVADIENLDRDNLLKTADSISRSNPNTVGSFDFKIEDGVRF